MVERNSVTNCKECGTKLDPMERHNAPALEGNCVGCATSPKMQQRRQQTDDMKMSPFTSVQRIHQHLVGAHGMSPSQADSMVGKVSQGFDIHHSTNQHVWRSLHDSLHAMGSGNLHDPASTHTGNEDDPFGGVFNDRR
jgi:hypothetical protein